MPWRHGFKTLCAFLSFFTTCWQCCHIVILVEVALAKGWMIVKKKYVVSYTLHGMCKCLPSQTRFYTLGLEVSICMKIFVSIFAALQFVSGEHFFVPTTWKSVVSSGVCFFFKMDGQPQRSRWDKNKSKFCDDAIPRAIMVVPQTHVFLTIV